MQNSDTKRGRIEAHRENVRLAGDVLHSLGVLADPFFRTLPRLPSERCIDLLNIAAGVFFSGRPIKRKKPRLSSLGLRSLAVTVGVGDRDFWGSTAIKNALHDIVLFLSDAHSQF